MLRRFHFFKGKILFRICSRDCHVLHVSTRRQPSNNWTCRLVVDQLYSETVLPPSGRSSKPFQNRRTKRAISVGFRADWIRFKSWFEFVQTCGFAKLRAAAWKNISRPWKPTAQYGGYQDLGFGQKKKPISWLRDDLVHVGCLWAWNGNEKLCR